MDIIPITGFAEPVNSISHLISAGVFLILAIITLYRGRGNAARMLGVAIYSFFAIALFSLSGVYHLLEPNGGAAYVLRILDHTAIFTMIAGSFTPFHIIMLRGTRRWLPLTIIWLLAITGLTLTAVFFSSISEGWLLSFFLGMGWMGIFTVNQIAKVNKKVAHLIVLGALLYTVGAIIDFIRWPILIEGVLTSHELFHFSIIAAALCHWRAIYEIAHYPVQDEITVVVRELPDQFHAYLFDAQCVAKAATMHELKANLFKWMRNNYPEPLHPSRIRFKFFKEEWMSV